MSQRLRYGHYRARVSPLRVHGFRVAYVSALIQ